MSEPNQDQILNTCPECHQVIDVTEVRPYEKIVCPHCQETIRVRNAFNNFTILSEIGEGGMSRVFRAQDNTLGREVALKILHTHFDDNPELQGQFEREAKVTASINHPNVVKVYSVGADQGYFFIAMELLDSASLDHQIREQGQIDETTALRLIHEVTEGLAAAHQRSLIHRDIKPGNILVDAGGTAKLVDFGLALVHGEEEQAADLWATPFYVPPEKLVGQPEDFRSDIYSLGATLFHMLSGQPPFDANTNSVEELIALKAQTPDLKTAAPHIGSETVSLVHRMMAGRPDARQPSYDELSSEISRIRQKIDPNFELPATVSRGLPLWLKLGGALVAVGFLGGMAALHFAGREEEEKIEISTVSPGPGDSEVIISAEETRLRRQLTAAREAMAGAESREQARTLFAEIAASEKARSDAKALADFHLGLLDLLDGDESAAREHFAKSGDGAESLRGAEKALVTTAAKHLAGAEKVDRSLFEQDQAGELKLLHLACGLRSWLRDDFQEAEHHLTAYNEAAFPDGLSWMGSYKSHVAPYLADVKLLVNLPAVSNDMDAEALKSALAQLQEAQDSLRGNRGAEVLKQRANRANARLQALSAAAMEEAAKRDLRRLREAANATASLPETMNFAEGAQIWRNVEAETEKARKLSHSIAEGWEMAAKFYPAFASRIATYRWEGKIRRRKATPFPARVVRADERSLVVDLGFGPTTLKLESLEPGGILDIAKDTMIDDFDSESRQAAAFFAWLIGEANYAHELAQSLQESPGFPRRWEAITVPVDFQ